MKMKQILFALTLAMSIAGCDNIRNQHSSKAGSPSGKYSFSTFINQSDKSSAEYGYVVIDLFDADGNKISSLNTAINSFKKWAIGWDSSSDIIVMYTREMGTFAWKIENAQLISIEVTDDIEKQADVLRTEKYN